MARETKGSGDTRFPVLDSRTSGPHVCSRDVSKDSVGQSWRFLLPLKFVSNSQSKKFELIKNRMSPLCPQSPSFLVPRPQSAKRSEKGYGDENELRAVFNTQAIFVAQLNAIFVAPKLHEVSCDIAAMKSP